MNAGGLGRGFVVLPALPTTALDSHLKPRRGGENSLWEVSTDGAFHARASRPSQAIHRRVLVTLVVAASHTINPPWNR